MSDFFHRQFALYAQYHRDRLNCLTHVFGIPLLFLAAVLPLSLIPATVLGAQTNLATLLSIPALMVWVLLDVAIGSAIVVVAALLLLVAYAIASHANVPTVYMIAAAFAVVGWAFQIVGHAVFERRRPAFLDNLTHMLIGPMFVVAKAFIRLGYRRDLSDALQNSAHLVVHDLAPHPAKKCAEVRQRQ